MYIHIYIRTYIHTYIHTFISTYRPLRTPMRTSSVGIVDHGLLFEGFLICASYASYWAIFEGELLFEGWATFRGFTIFIFC